MNPNSERIETNLRIFSPLSDFVRLSWFRSAAPDDLLVEEFSGEPGIGWIQIVSHQRWRVKRKSFVSGYYFATLSRDFSPALNAEPCYTGFALNASVVLCGPSGLDLLRLPA